MFQQIQNYSTNKLEVFRILLLIPNNEDFFTCVQLWSLIGRENMSLLWTLKSFICVQEWGHGRTLPKSSSLYHLYTKHNAKGRNETHCSLFCLNKGHSQQDWACWHTIYKTQFKGLLGYWQKYNLNLSVVTKRPSLTQAVSWVKHFDS